MQRILLTGATGYVGSRLLPRLTEPGRVVRCLVRSPSSLVAQPGVEVVRGDLLRPETLKPALAEIDVAYYLVHSMAAGAEFEELDRRAARNFARAARAAQVSRIVFLGGLGDESADLSPHLRSRHDVGRILRESGAVVIEFRAAVILGAGSLSFEMVRALTERLPVMITPRWVRVATQPISIEDVLSYLLAAQTIPMAESRIFEIGGPDRTSYLGLMKAYAQARGLFRVFLPVPVLTPALSSLWLHLVTPVHARIGRVLIEGVRNPTVVRDPAALRVFAVRPRGVQAAMEEALAGPAPDRPRPGKPAPA